MAARKATPRPLPVREVLEGVFKPGDWQALEQRRRIREVWERVVPPALRAQAALVELRRRELVVAVTPGGWMQELHFLKPRLLTELDQALGPGVVREVRCLPREG
jgi:predicted nucleic acid-binding Zn ribbon protein